MTNIINNNYDIVAEASCLSNPVEKRFSSEVALKQLKEDVANSLDLVNENFLVPKFNNFEVREREKLGGNDKSGDKKDSLAIWDRILVSATPLQQNIYSVLMPKISNHIVEEQQKIVNHMAKDITAINSTGVVYAITDSKYFIYIDTIIDCNTNIKNIKDILKKINSNIIFKIKQNEKPIMYVYYNNLKQVNIQERLIYRDVIEKECGFTLEIVKNIK